MTYFNSATNMDYIYQDMIDAIFAFGSKVKCRCLENTEILASGFCLTNIRNRLIFSKKRKISLPFAIGEFLWYWSGRDDLATMKYYSKNFDNFSDDGLTLNSAYGNRIFGANKDIGFDQLDFVIKKFEEDLYTRHAIIHIKTPQDSLKHTKDQVCTLDLQFFVRENKLHMITHMRSQDVIWGTPYDAFSFTMFQEILAILLNVEVGAYTHICNSFHIYDKFYEKGHNIVDEKNKQYFSMPKMEFVNSDIYSEDCDLNIICRLERLIRSADASINASYFIDEIMNCNISMYWKQLTLVLLCKKFNLPHENFIYELENCNCYKHFLRSESERS
ncbi:thymidylate synthase [Candidatus Pacearchaeota archaeon]|nr:thymidylate synthase [Candidatus Pacearchaeota archaeon]